MTAAEQIQALQNAADTVGLTIHQLIKEHKKDKIFWFYAAVGTKRVSPVLPYSEINAFLFGWIKCSEITPIKNT